jgi:hypothetical protein
VILAKNNGYESPCDRLVILARNIGYKLPSGHQAFFTKNIGWQTLDGQQVIIFRNIACKSPSEHLATLANILARKQILKEMDLKVKIFLVSMCRNQKATQKILFEIFLSYHEYFLCLLLTWQDMAKGFMFSNFINI